MCSSSLSCYVGHVPGVSFAWIRCDLSFHQPHPSLLLPADARAGRSSPSRTSETFAGGRCKAQSRRSKRTCTCGGARSSNARRGRGPPRFSDAISIRSRRSRSKMREDIDGRSMPLGRTAAPIGRRTGSRTPGRTFPTHLGWAKDLDTKAPLHRDLTSKISIGGAGGTDSKASTFDVW